MGMEISSDRTVCFRCGKAYPKRSGNFPRSYSSLYRGTSYMPICKSCIDNLYKIYLEQSQDPKAAVRQTCRKLDLYYSDHLYNITSKKSTVQAIMSNYLLKSNSSTYVGKCYDDTLIEEGTLWAFKDEPYKMQAPSRVRGDDDSEGSLMDNRPKESKGSKELSEVEKVLNEYNDDLSSYPITKEVIDYWGPGLEHDMYQKLEQRRAYWMSRIPDQEDVDLGMDAIIRQICSLELDINRDRAEGKSVDKNVNTLNTLLGSANWKPIQKKESNDSTLLNPMG